MAELLIHGNLHVTIFEVDSPYNPGRFRKILQRIADQGANRLYVTIHLEKVRVGQTRVIKAKRRSPRWDESFHIYCAHQAGNVVFSVKIDRPTGATVVGKAYVPVNDLLDGQEFEQWQELVNKKRKPIGEGARIRVKLRYFHVSHDQNWARGIRSPDFPGVPYTLFPQRKGCKVTLYQDAHVLDDFVPKIPLAGGQLYQPHRCWEDIFDAINNAQYLIYITGWSVYTEITLIRDSKRPKPGGDETLGQLLKRKASEGVKVLMLVWNDRTSDRQLKNNGLMATHDAETLQYFDGSEVSCVLCPRSCDNGQSFVQSWKNIMFTHHQKIVVVDSPLPGGSSEQRRIVSFVGGIDLCDGRYDTQFHPLFGTLDSVHHADFHQPNFTGGAIDKGGPREPWHDIHSKLEGSVAWDVLDNFQERWRKQSREYLLLPLKKYSETIPRPPVTVENDHDQETWNVQVFRSIDGGSAFGFPETPEDAARSGLVRGQDTIIDRSIQDAYINAIRRAKDFIYIENQYFLGSSYGWKPDDIKVEKIGALHLIPKELSLKIVTKIEAREQFRVYIVVPMWPEGLPESGTVQAILDWQRRTMEMMYKDIAQALHAKQMYDADPKEYLTFFCLGNREVKKSGEYIPQEHPKEASDYKRAQENRRFMIYVHSKMMIVDDEYIIIGSANVNQRSMDGARDSEIAMGAYQPYHLAVNEPARGQIHGFRMSLWYEHTGSLDNLFLQPESLECITKVKEIAEQNWYLYSSESLECDLPSHLLMYPVGVTNAGEVTELPDTKFFPDTKARVLGTKANDYLLPPILTT